MKYDCMNLNGPTMSLARSTRANVENCAECVWAHERETED